ncbi:Immunoglobulin I-set [Trinorchestia longiramus]|nr:Immunoglobulin I-set [Trinorchestia longiramus]
MLSSDMLNSDMLNSDMLSSDMLSSDMLNSDMLSRDMVSSDILNSDCFNPGPWFKRFKSPSSPRIFSACDVGISGTTGIGLEFTGDPAEQSIAGPGSVVLLSCSTNLPVYSMMWHLNHYPIPPHNVIPGTDEEVSEHLAKFGAPNCLYCEGADESMHHANQLQKNIKMISQNEILFEGKFLMGNVNGTSHLLVFLSQDEHEAAHQTGIYQCVATLGTISLVSAPGRLELATLAACPVVAAENVSVVAGSAVRVPCGVPDSIPRAAISFYKDGVPISGDEGVLSKFEVSHEGDLLLLSVSVEDAGRYHCTVTNSVLHTSHTCPTILHLHVTQSTGATQQLELISPKPGLVLATEGEDVMLRCVTNRGLANSVTWWTRSSPLSSPSSSHHFDAGTLIADDNIVAPVHLDAGVDDFILTNKSSGSGVLRLTQVSLSHAGQYVCHARDCDTSQPLLSVAVQLYIRAAPRVVSGLQPLDVGEGERLEVSCRLTGEPTPLVVWLSNGRLLQHSSQYSTSPRGVLIIQSVSKHDAGVLQCFGHNALGSVSSSALLTVTPATVQHRGRSDAEGDVSEEQQDPSRGPQHASSEALPPSRPTVTRVADDTVRLQWQHSPSRVRFYKVQYRVLPRGSPATRDPVPTSDHPHGQLQTRGSSSQERHRWQTEGEHISAERSSTLVSGLTPGTAYKFRVTAVLASYQQRVSPSSRRFLLRPMRPLLPPSQRPLITDVRWLQSWSDRQAEVQWRYEGGRGSKTDGFLISLRPANSSLPSTKRRFLGGERRSIVLTDIPVWESDVEVRVQAFNLAGPSPSSPNWLLPFHHRTSLPERGSAASLPDPSKVSGSSRLPVLTDPRPLWSRGSQGSGEEMDSNELSSRSDEGGSYSNESSYSNEEEDSDEHLARASNSSGLSSTHLLGLLVFVLLALLGVVAISYGLYSQRKKRAGYGVPLEQLSGSASEDHVSCAVLPQRSVRGSPLQAPESLPQLLNQGCNRAEVIQPASLSQPD